MFSDQVKLVPAQFAPPQTRLRSNLSGSRTGITARQPAAAISCLGAFQPPAAVGRGKFYEMPAGDPGSKHQAGVIRQYAKRGVSTNDRFWIDCLDRSADARSSNMGLWETIKSILGPIPLMPTDARRLDASSRTALSSSLRTLREGEQGWITFGEARTLFSAMEDQYAFGEMDEDGRANLAEFAVEPEHRSTFDFMPIEGRLYFTRHRV